MCGTFLSNYKYFSCQASCLFFIIRCLQKHYIKENINVGCSEQRRDSLFWIDLRETWVNIFMLLLAALNFLTFIFSTGIKLFIRHSVVFFGNLILLKEFNDFVQLPPWCILKDRQLCRHRYLKYEFYISLLLRQNKSRYKIRHWLELGCSCKWKQSTSKEI